MDIFSYDVCYKILNSFMTGHGILQPVLESNNHFMGKMIEDIIMEKKTIVVESDNKLKKIVWINDNIVVDPPHFQEENGVDHLILPSEARNRNLTYASLVKLSFRVLTYERARASDEYGRARSCATYKNKPLILIPVQVRSKQCNMNDLYTDSKECPLDYGGYYLVRGTEKVIIMQQKLRNNVPFVRELPPKKKFSHVCEIRCLPENKVRSTSTLYIHITAKKSSVPPCIYITIPFIKINIPLYHLFRLLDVESRATMIAYIVGTDPDSSPYLRDSKVLHLINCVLCDETLFSGNHEHGGGGGGGGSGKRKSFFLSKDDIVSYVGAKGTNQVYEKQRAKTVQHMINNEFLPHMGLDGSAATLHKKACVLGKLVLKLLLVYCGYERPDDMDDMRNKVIDTPGYLIALLFRQLYLNHVKVMQITIHKTLEKNKKLNPLLLLNVKKLTSCLQYPMATGNWCIQKGASVQTGVAQVLSRFTYNGTLSHLRRFNYPLKPEGKNPVKRQLNHKHWGNVCPCETPEGGRCGLMQNLSLLAHVRIGFRSDIIVSRIIKNQDRYYSNCDVASAMLRGRAQQQQQQEKKSFVPLEDMVPGSRAFDLLFTHTNVVVNGQLIGVQIKNAERLTKLLRKMRRRCNIPYDTSVSHNQKKNEILITTDNGNILRPVFDLRKIRKAGKRKFDAFFEKNAGTPNLIWNLLLERGYLTYVDKEEEQDYKIAPSFRHMSELFPPQESYTHMEIHPCIILGICANMIPFPEFNQGPRNMYLASMLKQRISMFAKNMLERFDTTSYDLCYGQKPLVQTVVDQMLHSDELKNGENPIVAVLCYEGFNVDDSIIFNRASIERGLFRAELFKTYSDEETLKISSANGRRRRSKRSNNNDSDGDTDDDDEETTANVFCRPHVAAGFTTITRCGSDNNNGGGYQIDDSVFLNQKILSTTNAQREDEKNKCSKVASREIARLINGNYDTIEEDGLPEVGTILRKGDAIIGKVIQTSDGPRNMSTFYKNSEPAQVCKVLKTSSREHHVAVSVKTRATRVPEVGDKFSSLHGQKGVIGAVLDEVDMPFTMAADPRASVRPDMIVNPHGFPSRMTIGQQLEMLLSKAVCCSKDNVNGDVGDGTAFQQEMMVAADDGNKEASFVSKKKYVAEVLKRSGYTPTGKERMINGITGELMEAEIFVCPVFFQRLKHMVEDKIHARSEGPVSIQTRQPTEGRSKDGGLRFGEMEKDNVNSHGAAFVLKDRMFEQSDLAVIPVCVRCGLLAENIDLEKISSSGPTSSSSSTTATTATATATTTSQLLFCRNCNSSDDVEETYLPYAAKLLLQELYALHIFPKLNMQ